MVCFHTVKTAAVALLIGFTAGVATAAPTLTIESASATLDRFQFTDSERSVTVDQQWRRGKIQDPTNFYTTNGGATRDFMNFRLFDPGVSSGEKAPLVVFLHGAGGRPDSTNPNPFGDGTSSLNTNQLQQAYRIAESAWQNTSSTPNGAFVLAPQLGTRRPAQSGTNDAPFWEGQADVLTRNTTNLAPETTWMTFVRQLIPEILNSSEFGSKIDTDRIILVGQSMGGAGSWSLLTREPDLFSRAVISSGSGATVDTVNALVTSDTAIWAMDHHLDHFLSGNRAVNGVDSGDAPDVSPVDGEPDAPLSYQAGEQLLLAISAGRSGAVFETGFTPSSTSGGVGLVNPSLDTDLIYTQFTGAEPSPFADTHAWATSRYTDLGNIAEWAFYQPSSGAIPEPTTAMLLAAGGCAILSRRRLGR